jgi:hypothetical protein
MRLAGFRRGIEPVRVTGGYLFTLTVVAAAMLALPPEPAAAAAPALRVAPADEPPAVHHLFSGCCGSTCG